MAYTGVDLSDHGRRYVLDQRYCRIIVNEEAIWRKIKGEPTEFPFHADDDVRKSTEHPSEVSCRVIVNQEAIWRKLCGEQVESLPQVPTREQMHWANRYQGTRKVREQCGWELLENQEAIWRRLCDQPVDSLPHPVNADVRDFAGFIKFGKNLEYRIWVNQDAVFNSLSRV